MKAWQVTTTAAVLAMLLESCDPVHRITKSATLEAMPDVDCVESALGVERDPPMVPADVSTTFSIGGVEGFGISITPNPFGRAKFEMEWQSVMSPSPQELEHLRALMESSYAAIRSRCA